MNADGYDDVVVGAFGYDGLAGSALIFLGSESGIAGGSPATAGARLWSNQAGAAFGWGVAGAGDVNGDGFDDVVVGAAMYDAGEGDGGAAFVFAGGPSGIFDGDLDSAATRIVSDQPGSWMGISVSGAGDVNGDNYDDVVIGAYQYSAGEPAEGAAFVYLGNAAGIADGKPTTASARIESDQASGLLGWSVSGAGDVNADGYDDVIVGARNYSAGEPSEGAAFVYLGGSPGIVGGNPAAAASQLESNQAGAQFGFAVSDVGDANGDGYDDVVVGSRYYESGEPSEGAAFLFLGGTSGIVDGGPETAVSRYESNQANAEFGRAVSGAGDLNGDGYDDLIVGAPFYDAGESNEGAAFVF
ncbi:MAG: FG-GAP repeat protein [Deltaproteobacteria bacterium]|nr:FG-GAP repeat protein [Deltaproteobacteria bacterium]